MIVEHLNSTLNVEDEMNAKFIRWIAAGVRLGRDYDRAMVFELYSAWRVAYQEGHDSERERKQKKLELTR